MEKVILNNIPFIIKELTKTEKMLSTYQRSHAKLLEDIASTMINHNSQYADKTKHVNISYAKLISMDLPKLFEFYHSIRNSMC